MFIVEQSNQFALECMGAEKFATWTQITVEELQAYMGFMMFVGLVRLPSIYDYWKKDETYHYSPIASRIIRERFFELHQYLHFTDNSTLVPPGSPEYNKLGKVQPVIDSLSQSFQEVYTPGKNVSVDEAMIPFKCRSSRKQYMPKKPVRRGIKVWALADSENGYIANFQVYMGKQGDTIEKRLGAKVVEHLIAPYMDSYRNVYFDNFFTGIDLLDLEKSYLYGCGTVRTNRKGFPLELKPVVRKRMKDRGDSKTLQEQCKNLTVSVWQDKPVIVGATNSDPTVEEQVSRKQCDGSSIAVSCPQSIVLYGNMVGVDNE